MLRSAFAAATAAAAALAAATRARAGGLHRSSPEEKADSLEMLMLSMRGSSDEAFLAGYGVRQFSSLFVNRVFLEAYGVTSFVDGDGDSIVYTPKDGKLYSFTNNELEGFVNSFVLDAEAHQLQDNFGRMTLQKKDVDRVVESIESYSDLNVVVHKRWKS
mmetsp:Transcript_20412/g.50090  ORF Transcript_20412/g.50090 Transcript_20412/m.50090 type:complete len:160 (+) Transcript_20412:55-534(+)